MRKNKITFGSHGHFHHDLALMKSVELKTEIENSFAVTRKIQPGEEKFIAYPFGSSDEKVKTTARQTGFTAGFSVWTDIPDAFSIPRIPMHRNDTRQRFRMKTSCFYFPVKKVFKRLQSTR